MLEQDDKMIVTKTVLKSKLVKYRFTENLSFIDLIFF